TWDDLRLPPDDVDIYARPPNSERRLVSRVRCFLSAEVICDGAGQKALAFVRDLSLGGCYVAMTFPFPLEAKVSIAMWLDEQVKIWTDGIVISSHPSTGMGVKFLGLSRANLALIEKWVKELGQTDKESAVRIWIPGTKQGKP
ncbi:MAG TPA: PilZ domain-containing protein, partial [Terriglobales bacterium]|nr:PilZ domain-containing protein [Terriglobales bacterium]